VGVEYEAGDVSLKATLTPEDKERFQRIVDLDQRGSLPPAASLGGRKSDRLRLTGELEEGASPPELIMSSIGLPDYPAAARTSHRSGRVKLAIRVLKDGTVSSLRPLEVTPIGIGFTKAAMDAVRQWRYKPALKDGQPVEADSTEVVEWSTSRSPMPR
jgi:protein TonB